MKTKRSGIYTLWGGGKEWVEQMMRARTLFIFV